LNKIIRTNFHFKAYNNYHRAPRQSNSFNTFHHSQPAHMQQRARAQSQAPHRQQNYDNTPRYSAQVIKII
jgi:hypothetical protein